MSKRAIALLAVLASFSFVVAACGDDDEEAAGATNGNEQMQQAEGGSSASGKDVVALAQETGQLSTLVQAVTAAELVKTLQGEGPFTVFAPTNEAFDAVGQRRLKTLLKPANRKQLQSVLSYHVVPGEVKAADLTDGMKVKSVQGAELTIRLRGDKAQVNDATVVEPDVEASNGVVHVIDGVLLPPT